MGWVVSVTPRPRFSPRERSPGTNCTGDWVDPRAGLDREARGKSLSPLPGIEPRWPGHPIRSQTLYWLSYPTRKWQKAGENCTHRSSIKLIRYQILLRRSTEEDLMGNACSTHMMRNAWEMLSGKTERARPLGKPSSRCTEIWKWISGNRSGGCGLESTGSGQGFLWERQRTFVSHKRQEFVD
jgi:hypothetical protein